MSQVVACPNCQTRYNLPETAIGKRVKCKSCGKPFSASVGASRAKQRQVSKASKGHAVDVAELERMGIGAIKAQPEIFAAEVAPGPDPLQNHVVHDPGFSLPGSLQKEKGSAESTVDNDFGTVVENPHLKGSGSGTSTVSDETAERRKREEKILQAYSTPSDGVGPKRKKKKSAPGINRLVYFLAGLGMVLFVIGLIAISVFLVGIQIDADTNPLEAGMMILAVGIITGIALTVISVLLVKSRYENMEFESPLWADLAAGITAAPSVMGLVSMGVGFIFGPLAIVFSFLGGLCSLLSFPVACGAIILPPKFGKTKQLDVVSYIWIGIIAFLILAGVVGAILR